MTSNRYKVDTDKLAEAVVPSYLKGRQLRDFVKCLLSPIQGSNNSLVSWANDMDVANKVTSQKIILEKYLTNQLKKYFSNSSKSFVIYHKNPITSNTFIYWHDDGSNPPPSHDEIYAFKRSDTSHSGNANFIYRPNYLGTSFYVECPVCNESLISKDEYESKIKAIVDRYKLASKNYKLMYKQ